MGRIKITPFALITLIIPIVLGLYILSGLYSIHWLASTTDYEMGRDFYIYYDALTIKAQTHQDPYAPYQIGESFLYHPFALIFLSLFSWLGPTQALFFWTALSIATWIMAILILLNLTDQNEDRPKPLQQGYLPGVMWLLFLTFAPFWETLYMGQINSLVVLLLALTFYYSENKHPVLAGVCLSLAIVFKTSPIIILLYFLVIRQFRVIAGALITLFCLTLLTAIWFGWPVVNNFFETILFLSGVIHPTKHNQSILSLSYRFLEKSTEIGLTNALKTLHKVLFAEILGLLLLSSIINVSWPRQTRLWLFGGLVVLMTISPPLVWYHHSALLLIPLIFMLRFKPYAAMGIGLIAIALIQGNRFFELNVERYAILSLLAHLTLISAMVVIYFKLVNAGRKKLLPIGVAVGFVALLALTAITLRDDEGVLLTQTLKQVVAPIKPASADFKQVILTGYRLDLTRLNANSEIYLTTFWQPVNPFAEVSSGFPVKVFVHLRNRNNENVAQADHILFGEAGNPQPFTGYLAISAQWDIAKEKRRPLQDETTIPTPINLPSGLYQLYIGLYDPDTLERYQIVNGVSDENAVLLGDVIIQPR
jgi:hypothetical protein